MQRLIKSFQITFTHFKTGMVTEIASGDFDDPIEGIESKEWESFINEMTPIFYSTEKTHITSDYTCIIRGISDKDGCFKIIPIYT